MFVDLTQWTEEELRLEHHYLPDQFDMADDQLTVSVPPHVFFHLRRLGREIRVQGHVTAELMVPCDRCLAVFRLPVETSFDVFYAPIEVLTPEEEVELTERDLTFGFYRNDLIDLTGLVREQIRLALPFRLLCREDCRGLCPRCGVDLNEGDCGCRSEEIDARWAALAELRKRLTDVGG